jgi:hydroxypyruvate isomerase
MSGDEPWAGYELIANVSMLYADMPVAERPAAARANGFHRIESWWPFAGLEPDPAERAAFVGAVADAGVALVSLNTFAGDMAAGDRGLAAVPRAADSFRRNLAVAVGLVAELGGSFVHVLLGNADPTDPAIERTALAHLTEATVMAGDRGLRVLVEVLNPIDTPRYALTALDRAVRWIELVRERSGSETPALQFDAYHLTMIGEDLVEAVERSAHVIGHVQVADVPGRGAPGTGTIDFARFTAALRRAGYTGSISLEHRPEPVTPV